MTYDTSQLTWVILLWWTVKLGAAPGVGEGGGGPQLTPGGSPGQPAPEIRGELCTTRPDISLLNFPPFDISPLHFPPQSLKKGLKSIK